MTTSFFLLPARAAGRYPQVNARSVQPGSGKGRRCAPPYQAAPWRVRISTPCLHCTPVVLACKQLSYALVGQGPLGAKSGRQNHGDRDIMPL